MLPTTLPPWLLQPPGWICAIIVAVIVAHALKLVLEFFQEHREDSLIQALELLVTLVLAYLALEAYISGHVSEANKVTVPFYDQPIALVAILVFFSLLSLILYLAFKRLTR